MLDCRLNKKYIKQVVSLLLILYLFFLPKILCGKINPVTQKQSSTSFVYKKLCTPNPSLEAEALYRYLQNISGEKILSGQMCTPRGINETEYIYNISGKQPALRGIDFEHVSENEAEIQNMIKWWKKGGIPVIRWNWGAPTYGDNYESSRKEINIERCFQEGTPEHESFWQELTTTANRLEALRDTNVPVLWNPFHEQNGKLFWWGKKGPTEFHKLWQTMFNYFVHERKLNNLIWVSNFSENVNRTWFPGNNFVDIIGVSTIDYDTSPQTGLFEDARKITAGITAPLAFHTCTTIPSPDECREKGTMWSWWMQRPTSFLEKIDQEYLFDIYHHDMIITLDEVPNIVQQYSTETVTRDLKSGTIIPFTKLKGFGIGTKPDNISFNNKHLQIEVKGKGIDGKKDAGYFTFKQITGDFDISVQVLSLSPVHAQTTAGIMARVDLSKSSQHVFFQLFPGNDTNNRNPGGCGLIYRTQKKNETKVIITDPKTVGTKFNVDYPNTWIRLKRRGNIFKSYISHDNSNWHTYSVHEQKMPDKLLLGLVVSSHNTQKSTKAEFKDLEITWE